MGVAPVVRAGRRDGEARAARSSEARRGPPRAVRRVLRGRARALGRRHRRRRPLRRRLAGGRGPPLQPGLVFGRRVKEALRGELGHLRPLLRRRSPPLERPRARLGARGALEGRGRGRLEGVFGGPPRPPHEFRRRRPRTLRILESLSKSRDLAARLQEAAAVVDDLVDAQPRRDARGALRERERRRRFIIGVLGRRRGGDHDGARAAPERVLQ